MSFDPSYYNRIEAARRDAEIRYESRRAQARAEKAAEWPEKRAQIVRHFNAAKRAAEESGEPFVMLGEMPPMEAPEWWLREADAHVPDPPIHVPEPAEMTVAPGVDALGRPTERLLTAEEQFAKASRGSLREKVRRAVGG